MENLVAVFGLSFLTALSGALQPGPLLTYTIMQTLHAPRRGWLVGPRIITGHAVIELSIIIALLAGLSVLLTNEVVVRIIGCAGAGFMVLLAILTVRDVVVKKVELPGKNTPDNPAPQPKRTFLGRPEIGGALISMSNPFWWIWWATIGFFFMREYGVALSNMPLFFVFFMGHELGDLTWYSFVSIAFHTGKRFIGRKAYHVILLLTAAMLAGFAVYIAWSAFQYKS